MQAPVSAFGLSLVLALCAAAAPAAPQSDSGPLPDRQVSAGADPCLRLRSGASVDRVVLDCLEPGTRLRLLGAISGWSHVRLLDGTEGWIDSGYLEMAPELPTGRPAGEPSAAPTESSVDPDTDLQGQIAALEGQLQAAANRNEAAESAQREAVALGERVSQLERANAGAADAGRLEAGSARVSELEAALAAAQSREAASRQELAAVEARLRAAESSGAEQARRIESLTARLADTEVRLAEAELAARLAGRAEPSAPPPAEPPVRVRAPIVSAPEPPRVTVREPAPPVEEATAPEPQAPATDAAIDAVRAWAAAWSDQRVEDYLSFYAASFQPPDGLGRAAWEAQRRQRLSRPRYIEVTITSLEAEVAGDGAVRATFRQEYESDTYADAVTKVLTLAAENGAWLIVDERATP